MNYFGLVSVGAIILWMGVALTWAVEWDIHRQHLADLWIQHGAGIRHKSGCDYCGRKRIVLRKKA